MIASGQQAELTFMLDAINLYAKFKLFEQVVGKDAHDKGHYAWNDKELSFLRYAELIIGDDGLMRIINLKQNKGYKEFYKKGEKNHGAFADKMKFLGKYLPWEFKSNNDFHQDGEMVFTQKSTDELRMLGLDLNTKAIKSHLLTQNRWALFTRTHTADIKTDQVNIQSLPEDLLYDILK
jgi:hypothetical protein